MKFKIIASLILMTSLFANSIFAQAEPVHGNGALEIFDSEGQANSPQWVMNWIMFMAATFAAGLFFVKNHPIARWVVGGFVAGIVCLVAIERVFGVPPISGYIATMHLVFWSPGLYQLLTKRPFMGERSAFAIWSGIMTLVILFSFVFDIRDSFIYLSHIL